MRSALLLSLLMIGVVFAPVTMALDGDGDGIDDSLDMCPYAAGTANSTNGNGCPDADGDGLADFEEEPMYNWDNSFRELFCAHYVLLIVLTWALSLFRNSLRANFCILVDEKEGRKAVNKIHKTFIQ